MITQTIQHQKQNSNLYRNQLADANNLIVYWTLHFNKLRLFAYAIYFYGQKMKTQYKLLIILLFLPSIPTSFILK